MTRYLARLSDEQIARVGGYGTLGLIAAATPACLYWLDMVSPFTRVYIAVLSVLLVAMFAALFIGVARESIRATRALTLLYRRFDRRRQRATVVTTTDPTPALAA